MRYAFAALILLGACQPGSLLRRTKDCPDGYVPVDTHGRYEGRAVSAEGVVIGIRRVKNDQEATLDFWTRVVKKDFVEGRGYALRSEDDLAGGHAMLFSVPSGKESDYWLALFVTPDRIHTVEVAGPRAEVQKDLPRLKTFVAGLPFVGGGGNPR